MASPQENPQQTPPPGKDPQKPSSKETQGAPSTGPWLIILLILVIGSLMLMKSSPENTGSKVDYSFFIKELKRGNVDSVDFHGDILTGKWKVRPKNPDDKDKKKDDKLAEEFNTVLPSHPVEDRDLVPELIKQNVTFKAESTSVGIGTYILPWLIGPLLIIGFFWFMLRRSADPMGSGMLGNFTKSPAKRFRPSEEQTTFDDVAAMEQAKAELQEVVEFLKTPAKFQRLGAQIPKGVLLMGSPGTGKTLLARATAGEAGVPFYSINGSEFIQMFVGVGASRVRDLFRNAKENAPCIIFVDEIDAVGRIRGAGLGGGHDEREQTLNQMLSEMDGFQQNEAVIVIAATNRPDVLDPALLRPGRFDRHITVDRPTKDGRAAILKVHSRKIPLSDDVDLEKIAAGTIGFSGADLKNLVNEAALSATRLNKDQVDKEDFDNARDRVLMGPPREEILSEKEREMTAYHEAGHALLAWLLPEIDPVHKVTVIPRGRALGVTQLLPDEERYNMGEKQLHSQLAFMLGGRAAEGLVFGEHTAGAADDIKRATQITRKMVGQWGMSDVIGPVAFRHSDENPFLGKEMKSQGECSEETAHVIDQEMQRFLNAAEERAEKILTENREKLDLLAKALVEHEAIDSNDIKRLIGVSVREQANLDNAKQTGTDTENEQPPE
ncbi:ATP-dependent zinc metalloprotease FtsH [Gimesia panareensis]|uniref:ATP-dependent zinc metalloprotease FtsH n=1 Tax=Gimesia panareensis TaxID=2527978 RepID=A0A518FK35_9PLAN|nr:ATP-dependent zinc metalloprotease FtsH [Gimesia panareensis]QDT27146.1 ATP-dependent zinc metalloprotease FtsH [Gimesia panareensis]QDV16709.1 ATP-dependent zinc metalloprotease FtsH [Gimesia panareensis]